MGKAIVFAHEDIVIGDTRSWLDDETVRDIPQPGERILRGRPVCTVFAIGATAAACYEALTTVPHSDAFLKTLEQKRATT